MKKTTRTLLLASTALGFMLAGPAHAADATTDAIKALQAQVNALQKQLNEMQTKEKAAAKTAAAAPAAAPASAGEIKEILPGVKTTFGGYIEADATWRDKNQTLDSTSNINTSIPFNNVANAHQSEFRGSARASRISVLAEGNVSEDMKLAAYVESDFLGAGTSSNSLQTNSYVPRLRQAFATVDRNDWGLRFLAGQAYSMVTLTKSGITARQEVLPMVIDSVLVAGTNYTRQAQVRVVKDLFDKKVAVGLSAESPQTSLGGVTAPTAFNVTNPGGSSLNSSANYSTDLAPDIIAKVAFDPGWGHYEVFGITRFFHDNVLTGNNYHNNVAVGYGGGLGATLPVVSKYVDVEATMMAGKGIGRYSAGQLPDIAFAPDGTIKPLTQYTARLGVVTHPTPTWDVYAYIGAEKVMRQAESGGGVTYGYGNYTANNTGCNTQGAAAATCQAQTKMIWQITPGFWKTAYKGNYGTLRIGAQYSLVERLAFSDSNGHDPHAFENIVMTSFRYSPF